MRFLTRNNTITWLNTQKILNTNGTLNSSIFPYSIEFYVTDDSGKKTALSKFIVSMFTGYKEVLVWIDEFGIWPSCENWHLIEVLRNSVGEKQPLFETPGLICSGTDEIYLTSLLCLILYFNWGAYIVESNNTLLIRINHDGLLTTRSSDSQIIKVNENAFENFKKIV